MQVCMEKVNSWKIIFGPWNFSQTYLFFQNARWLTIFYEFKRPENTEVPTIYLLFVTNLFQLCLTCLAFACIFDDLWESSNQQVVANDQR